MRAMSMLLLIVGSALAFAGAMAAQTQLQIRRSLPLKNSDTACVDTSFAVQSGKAKLKVTNKCLGVTVLACTYRSAMSAWDCEKPPLPAAGQAWLAPFAAEPSAVYYVGACKIGNSKCEETLDYLYSHIIGRPRTLDPEQIKIPEPCEGTSCPPPPPPPPPPAAERG